MRVQITNGMFMALIINMIYAKAIGVTQGSISREVGNDMWLSTTISILQGILIMFITILVIKRAPELDLVEQCKLILGKWGGKFIALIFFIYFMLSYGVVMITFVYHLRDYFLPEMPTIYFIIAALIVGSFGIFHGLEVISRMALLGIFSILALNILILIGSIQNFDIRELLPTFESGLPKIVWASRHHNSDWGMATMMAALILPHVKEIDSWKSAGVNGSVFSGMFILLWPILEAGVLTSEVAGQYIISCMQMARSASIGVFLHRYEMVMVAFFALSSLTQIMMTLFCASIALEKITNTKNYRKLILPVTLILGGFGYYIVNDHRRAMYYLETNWITASVSIAILLPVSVWLLGFIFKKKLHTQKKPDSTTSA
ncbi:GerAB/ArcD/ProY family transporter [Bacillus marasmi]|uniref:GerAB/ArcD/ProY family transporter n=1 Tax=Bacillus marasmi TaxID=1926279 RepID=UPI0011C9D5D4|nr:GerAB/ArcD/ProY family transporter [Bacillus marasmi]